MIVDLDDLCVADVNLVLALLDKYELEVPNTFGHTLDKDHIRNLLYFLPPTQKVYVYVYHDKVVGLLWLHKATLLIANEPYVGDVLFYVKKEHRGSNAAVELLIAGKQWAKQQGAVSFQMGAFSGIDTRAEGLYSKMGMDHFGTTWIQRL